MLVLDLAYRATAVRMRDEAYGRLDHIEILVNNVQSGWRPRLRLAESLQLTALWWCRIGSLGLAILDGFFGLQRIRVHNGNPLDALASQGVSLPNCDFPFSWRHCRILDLLRQYVEA